MGLVAGIYSEEGAPPLHRELEKMIASQGHRGLGASVVYYGRNVAIGMINPYDDIHCRTRNDDASKDHYFERNSIPGIHAFLDGMVLSPLPASDVPCSTILATAYERWGLDFMNHLEGEFSCVVWDEPREKLVMARDPYGHKPLHYTVQKKRLYFSSEIKGILSAGVPAEVDLISLSDFLSFNHIPSPATIFKGIFQVPPGCMVVVSEKGITTHPYRDHRPRVDQNLSLEDAEIQLAESIRNAVKKRMVTQDTYCFLSGGIDSSAVASFAAELSEKPIHAISVGFEEEAYDESEYAAIMAKHVGAEFSRLIARPDSFFDMLDSLVRHHDSPFWDSSAYPTFLGAELARTLTDVILTGDGPDQMMGIDDHYLILLLGQGSFAWIKDKQRLCNLGYRLMERFIKDPTPSFFSKVKRNLYWGGLSYDRSANDIVSICPDIVKKFLCTDDLWKIHMRNDPFRHLTPFFRKAEDYNDINNFFWEQTTHFIPEDLKIKTDRMCMAQGLETLSPFQDRQVSMVVKRLPAHFKTRISPEKKVEKKYILRRICRKRFPEPILKKKKQGFAIPLEKWLKQDNGKYVREILMDSKTHRRGYFKKESLEKYLTTFFENREDWFFPKASGMVALLTIELWHRRYIDVTKRSIG